MFQVLRHQIVGNVAAAPGTIPDRPEVFAPVPLLQLGELLLQDPRGPSLQPLDEIADGFRWRIFEQHMDVIFTDDPFEDAHIFGITDLDQQRATPLLDVALEHLVAVFRYPDDVDGQATDRMTAVAGAPHRRPSYHRHGGV